MHVYTHTRSGHLETHGLKPHLPSVKLPTDAHTHTQLYNGNRDVSINTEKAGEL